MKLKPLNWLFRSETPADEGAGTAVYPYDRLEDIFEPEDCRRAVLDSSGQIEAALGREALEPIYQLLWTLNTSPGVFTSHVAFSTLGHRPFDWAKFGLGVLILMLLRPKTDRHQEAATKATCQELLTLLDQFHLKDKRDTTGWKIGVRPCNVRHHYFKRLPLPGEYLKDLEIERAGFGVELLIEAGASNQQVMLRRWQSALRFINEALVDSRGSERPALPYQHQQADLYGDPLEMM